MNLAAIERSLRWNYEVITAPGPEDALELLKQGEDVAVIVSDFRMPGMNGTQFLAETIKYNPQAKRIIISGYADLDGVIDAINCGQIHYFFRKPWDQQELDRTIERLVHVHRLEQENRALVEELRIANEELRGKEQLLAKSLNERARELLAANRELERMNRELTLLAYRDSVTGLYNHRTFHERLREELSRARRYSKPISVILCDLDHFKMLNQQYGHTHGDEILRRVAEILRGEGSGRESDVVARYGGEEFVLLLPETPKSGGRVKAERLCQAVRTAMFPGNHQLTMSFGVCCFPDDAKSADELMALADHALYMAKRGGRDQVQVYGEGLAVPSQPLMRTTGPSDVQGGAVPFDAETTGTGTDVFFPRGGGESPQDSSNGRTIPGSLDEFPTYHERLYSIIHALKRERAIGCLYVDLARLRRVELEYGVFRHSELLTRVGRLLLSARGEKLHPTDLLSRADGGDAFVFFLSASRGHGDAPPEELVELAQRVQEQIDSALAREVFDLIHDHPRIAVGYSRILHNPMVRPERLITKLVDEAKESANLMRRRQAQRDKDLLQEIILNEQLTPVYQPIVHLGSGEIFGFEALTRGPAHSPLEAPLALFSVAQEVNLLFELDRACFRGVMRGAAGLEPVHRLFVNLLPLSFYDPSFIENEMTTLLQAANLTPANIVFEITERLAIEDFRSFRRALGVYTGMGCGIAIDDVGTKHSNLEAVMALRPHFVKLSDILTRGAARSTVKREMLRSLGRISEAIDAVMVAEGIETPEDLLVLKDMGVKYGQGYFLGRPGSPFPKLRASVRRAVQSLHGGGRDMTPAPMADDFDDEGEFRETTRPPGFEPQAVQRFLEGFEEETTDTNIDGDDV